LESASVNVASAFALWKRRDAVQEGEVPMSVNHADDIKRYQPNVDEKAVAAIVKHLGIALKSADASLVSCSSKDELATVRESWLKKKLGLTDDDAKLDKLIGDVCTAMKSETRKSRVTFYYLLAEKAGKLPALTSAKTAAAG
jgi:hypothetical protein